MITYPKPTPATAIDHDQARWLSETVDVLQRECYKNSILTLAAAADTPIRYIEGWLILEDGAYPIEHGWLQEGDTVLDVTIHDELPFTYYPVFSYDFEEVNALVKQRGKLPFWNRTKKTREIMRASFRALPVDHEQALFWSVMGEIVTGITGVVLTKESSDRRRRRTHIYSEALVRQEEA